MLTQDKISIIVPVYNVEKYLNRCVNSLLNQTYSNIEIILIDDGSTDKSSSICDYFKTIDLRVKVLHTKNFGVSKARNTALNIVNSKYLTFVDADDYVDKNYVKELYELCEKNDCDIAIIGTVENNEIDKKQNNSGDNIDIIFNNEEAFKELLNEKFFFGSVWGKIYKTDIWQGIYFNEKTSIGEDLEVLYKVFFKSNKIKVNTNKRLYYYTKNRIDSATKSNYNKKWKREISICENILLDCKENHEEIFSYALKRYIRINYSCIVNILKNTPDDKINYEKLKSNILKYKSFGIFNKFNLEMKIKLVLVMYFRKIAVKILYEGGIK